MLNFSVSVIIPTFNRADVLARAIESVLQQSLQAKEIIVVDDGSTDDTRELIRSFQLSFSDSLNTNREGGEFLRYIYQHNSGVSAARNSGIHHAGGEWIAFLDSDDAWLPDKLKSQAELIEQHPGFRLCHTQESWIRHGVRVNQMKKHAKSGGHIFQQCLPLCVISPSSVVIHRALFEDTGLFDETLPACEDYDLWLRICAHEAVLFVETPQILKYGGHDDQLSRKHWGMDRFRIRALQKILHDPGLDEEQQQLVVKTLLRKARILYQGAVKRNNRQRAEKYRRIEATYSSRLAKDGAAGELP
ncbi:MAG TPA: glycosyl transferase [Gammaproteobacteria bacterium]|nr:glycosyl transferase [Gammaproteobacteria bacterium]